MKINIVYNSKTGNIFQIHTGVESQGQILDRIFTTGRITNLSILSINKLPDDISNFKVDVKTEKLIKTLPTETAPFGGSNFKPFDKKKYAKLVKEAMKLPINNLDLKISDKKKK